MDRRESLRVLLLGALGARSLGAPELQARLPRGSAPFRSRWTAWPDMSWAGPEYWGNRLQDWRVRGGRLVCRTRGPDRTLHCLTHRVAGADFTSRVRLAADASGLGGSPSGRVGLRFGLKGRFPGVRSAAVHGTGLDAAMDGAGHLWLGEDRSADAVDPSRPVELHLSSRVVGGDARVVLTAGSADPSAPEAPTPPTVRVEALMPADAVLGNLAILSHQELTPGNAAVFFDWAIDGPDVSATPSHAFGPVWFAQYTLHRGVLKLTAQLAPIDAIEGLDVGLELRRGGGGWTRAASASIDPLSRTAEFRLEGWDGSRQAEYRVVASVPLASGVEAFEYRGTIAAEPSSGTPLQVAVFSCNADHGFPDAEVVEHVGAHEPDVAVFLGDQFYEGNGGFGIQREPLDDAALDMLHKWAMFGWSYRDIYRRIPSAFIPDDHDVYHGNIWGEGGKAAPTEEGWGAVAQDQGGFKMPAEWVNAVQRCQTSHLPDPFDATPVNQGIGVYYTDWTYGGVSFAILEDRKFKSAPGNVLPAEARVVNGWIQNPDYDIREHRDPPEARLLGERQMRFLEEWIGDWSGGAYQKVVLSQTNFAAVHTIPRDATSGAVLPSLPMPAPGRYVEGDRPAVDMDSNGWPRERRDDVLRILRRGAAFHIAGDQHLATVVRHGIDDFDDAGFTFTGPALNNIWPRRWWPPRELREAPLPGGGPDYTGRFRDGFGNRMTVHASANPRATGLEPAVIRDRVTGYGIVTFDKAGGTVTVECWPRQADPTAGDRQYEGWPLVLRREDGDGRSPTGFLPEARVEGLPEPVIEVRTSDGTLVHARRIVGTSAPLPVFADGSYTVRVGDPDAEVWQETAELVPLASEDQARAAVVSFRFRR